VQIETGKQKKREQIAVAGDRGREEMGGEEEQQSKD
jgi:hypothetical protein